MMDQTSEKTSSAIASLERQKSSINARYRSRIDQLERELERELYILDQMINRRQQLEKQMNISPLRKGNQNF